MANRSRKGFVALSAVAVLCTAAPASAGSYMQSGGDLAYSSSLGYLWATQQWDHDGDLGNVDCRRDYQYNSHRVEYGQSYYRTLFGGVNLARSSCDPDATTGLGDIRIGMRGRFDVFRNHRTWEIEATLPTPGATPADGPTLGCGSLGLAGSLAIKEKVLPMLSLGAGAGVQLWRQPLAHQLVGDVSAGGTFGRWSPWSWEVGFSGKRPLNPSDAQVTDDISDCGTRSQVVKGGARLSYQVSDVLSAECGGSQALWGTDVGRTTGFYCGFSRLWKG